MENPKTNIKPKKPTKNPKTQQIISKFFGFFQP